MPRKVACEARRDDNDFSPVGCRPADMHICHHVALSSSLTSSDPSQCLNT